MQEEKNEVVIFRVPLCKQGEPEMKKKTVSKDPLAEKIEEILAPYPNPMSRNDFRIVCHIGTRTSLYLLQSGLVPCKNNGKRTR